MLGQTFSLVDIPRLLTLIFLEGALSVDNALAIAAVVRGLPYHMRQKALFIGLFSAVVLRAFGVISAAYLIQLYWVQLLGGAYLVYLSFSHLLATQRAEGRAPKRRRFWSAVVVVELTDFIFAIDSILAGLALIGVSFAHDGLPPKIWIVYVGGLAGLIMMRFAAQFFTTLMDRFPRLEIGAHLIVGWVGLKLLLDTFLNGLPSWTNPLFWGGVALFFIFGCLKKRLK